MDNKDFTQFTNPLDRAAGEYCVKLGHSGVINGVEISAYKAGFEDALFYVFMRLALSGLFPGYIPDLPISSLKDTKEWESFKKSYETE